MSLISDIMRPIYEDEGVEGNEGYIFTHRKPEVECIGIVSSDSGCYGRNAQPSLPSTPSTQAMGADAPSTESSFCFLALDFETYYDGQYNLKKSDIPAYTYDPRFHAHGLAAQHPNGESEFRTDVPEFLIELQRRYGKQLEQAVVVFHNAYFDYFLLFNVYGIRVQHIADTMLMSRLVYGPDADASLEAVAERCGMQAKGSVGFMRGVLNPTASQLGALSEYAINDVKLTGGIARILASEVVPFQEETFAMAQSVRQYVERTLTLDPHHVERIRPAINSALSAVLAPTGLSEKEMRSQKVFPAQLTEALSKTGRELPMKQGRKGLIPALSKADPEWQALRDDGDPRVKTLALAKSAVGSVGGLRGRASYLEAACSHPGGSAHFQIAYHRAGPGRYAGGGGFNIQNVKKSDPSSLFHEAETHIARSITARPAHTFLQVDASQIEARILAFQAGQHGLHKAFATGVDVYSQFASKQFNREVRKPVADDSEELARELKKYRQIGKQAILGLGYNMGVSRFIESLMSRPATAELFESGLLSQRVCASIVYGYRDMYANIPGYWKDCESCAGRIIQYGGRARLRNIEFSRQGSTLLITLPSGRRLVYQNARLTSPTYKRRPYINRAGQEDFVEDASQGMVYGAGKHLYGGKIVENIIQAIARDILVHVIIELETRGLPVVLHCHDSVTVQVRPPEIEAATALIQKTWADVPAWVEGLALDSEATTGTTLGDL